MTIYNVAALHGKVIVLVYNAKLKKWIIKKD